MPTASASRTIACRPARAVGARSATRTTCRAGGRASRASRTWPATRFTQVIARPRASRCAPTSALSSASAGAATRAGRRSSRARRSSALLERGADARRARAGRGGHERDDAAAPEAARLLPALRRVHGRAARRERRSTRRSTGWSGSRGGVAMRRPRCAGGAGATRPHAGRAAAARARRSCASVGVDASAAPAGGARGRAAAGARRSTRRRATGCAAIVGDEHVRDDRLRTRRPRGGQGLPRPRAPARRRRRDGAPDAVVAAGRRGQVAAVLRAVRARARWRSCPSAAARASSAAWRRCAGASRRVIALDTEPPGAACSRSTATSRTATLGAGLRAPGARAPAQRARPHARPLPAVVRVRHDRRLRGDALGRAGVDAATARSTSWCSGCAGRAERATRRSPAHPRKRRRARRCASSWSAPRGRWA